MKTLNIACLHGIGTSRARQATYALRWQVAMRDALSESAIGHRRRGEPVPEVDVHCRGMSWDSTGNAAEDIARIVADKRFREAQLDCVEEQLRNGLAGVDLIVTHSLGCSLIMPVLSRLQALDAKPMLFGIGGPHSHPIWGRALSWVGLRHSASPYWDRRRPIHFWNQDDMVCSLGTAYSAPPGWTSTRIGHPGEGVFAQEHVDLFYLTSTLFIEQLEAL